MSTCKAVRLTDARVQSAGTTLRESAQHDTPLRNSPLYLHSNHVIEHGACVFDALTRLGCPRREPVQIIPARHFCACQEPEQREQGLVSGACPA